MDILAHALWAGAGTAYAARRIPISRPVAAATVALAVLPDIVQILWHGRKTCALRIQAQGTAGEIHFGEGQIVNALWGSLKGEEAFYKMLTLTEGDFRVDPTFKPTVRIIQASPEGLLLEGMRRLDEHGG